MSNNCGIYKITNPNGKIYIGQSIDLADRKKSYKRLHCNRQPKLYNSIKKYGWENHNFEIVSFCNSEELNELEKYYINLFNCFDTGHGLNLMEGGGAQGKRSIETRKKMSEWQKGKGNHRYGKKASPETKKLLSALRKGKPRPEIKGRFCAENSHWYGKHHTKETKKLMSIAKKGKIAAHTCRCVLQYTKHNIFIREYSSIKIASKQTKISTTSISNCLRLSSKTCGGFIWKYKNHVVVDKITILCKPIIQYDKNNAFVNEYYSITNASKKTGIIKSSISQCLKGTIKQAGGFIWKYKMNDIKRIA